LRKQIIKSPKIDKSNIYQVGRDLIQISYNAKSEMDSDIYFIYGDSDVQFLLYGVGKYISEIEYYDAMDNAFRLLLAFKPYSSRIVITASSVITSYLTDKLIQYYKCFANPLKPHVSILRRESNWEYYFEKRRENTKNLKNIKKYELFYNSNIIEKLEGVSTLRKETYSGVECSEIWVEKAEKIISNIPSNKKISLSDLPEEILHNTIFVWETIEERLNERGIIVPSWSKDLQYALVESYLSTFSSFFLFPLRINLPWDFWSIKSYFYFTNIKLLNLILDITGFSSDFCELSPPQLLEFIKSEDFLEYKYRLDLAKTINELFLNAKKYRHFLTNAFKSISMSHNKTT